MVTREVTEAQAQALSDLGVQVRVVRDLEKDLSRARQHLGQLMLQANDPPLKVSSYKIAETVELSQPRINQIIKEARDGDQLHPDGAGTDPDVDTGSGLD